MNTPPSRPPFGHQRGLSLIELMIGVTLGLLLVIALGYLLVGSRALNRTQDDVARMQESARYALELMGLAIRQAGNRSNADEPFQGTALTATNGTPDSITVQYDAQEGGERDCTGALVAAGALVTYAFAVNGSRELTCNDGVVANNVVVADNIENLQIRYGIDSNKDGVIESYTATPSAAEFSQAAAVRVSLLVRSPSANTATGNQTYSFDGAAPVTSADRFLRQVYSATFTVRNQAW